MRWQVGMCDLGLPLGLALRAFFSPPSVFLLCDFWLDPVGWGRLEQWQSTSFT